MQRHCPIMHIVLAILPWIGTLVLAGIIFIIGWVRGDWNGYDRAQREWREAPRTPPLRFPKILFGDRGWWL